MGTSSGLTAKGDLRVLARRLEALNRTVGAVGLGCVGMSAEYNTRDINDAESLRVIARALDLGVTLFDTADVYGPFANELLVGHGIRGRAADVVVATKVGLVQPAAASRLGRRADPGHIRASCEASLRRLGVDAIDVYYLHRVDPAVPLEESWSAMARNRAILTVIERVARRHNATLGQISIAWVLAQDAHVVAIPGTKRLHYLEENCQAARLVLSAADLADLNTMPQASGDRY